MASPLTPLPSVEKGTSLPNSRHGMTFSHSYKCRELPVREGSIKGEGNYQSEESIGLWLVVMEVDCDEVHNSLMAVL